MLAVVTSHPIQYQAPLWRALAAEGLKFEVWFLTPHAVHASYDREFGKTFAWDVDLLAGYPHRFLAIEPGWTLKRFRGIKLRRAWADEFRESGATDVWVEGWRFAEFWNAIRSAHANGLRVWLRGENHALAPEPWTTRCWKRPLLRWLFRRVDHFLCIGRANRAFYELHGVRATQLHPAPYCVDHDYFATAAAALRPQRAELRAAWGIAPGAKCLLFCGKLIPKKRPLDVVAAARLLPPEQRRDLHLLFAGDGELRPALEAALRDPQSPRATLAGFLNQSEIPRAFAAADSLVLPSDFGETWGLVVNEALASGVPAIVSDRCGCAPDLAAPLGPQHVFPCGDTAALAARLRALWEPAPPPALLHQLSAAHAPAQTARTAARLLGQPAPR